MLAALCWITARSLLFCECPGKGRPEVPVLHILHSFVGHVCNTVGALLTSQLDIQILTGAYMAAADIIRFLLALFPVCPSESQKTAGLHCRRRRRRHVRDSLLVLALPLSVGAGRFVTVIGLGSSQESLHGAQRRLLGAVLQDNKEVLGFVLGLLSALLAFTARMPSLSRACRGKPRLQRQLWATLCSAAAGVLYAAAIVTRDQQPAHVLKAMPWLLIALGSAALDVAIPFVAWVVRSQKGWQLVSEIPDAWPLLAEEEKANDEGAETADWAPLNMFPKSRSRPRTVAASHCLDLMIRLVQQTGCNAARLPGDGRMSATDAAPLDRPACSPLPALHAGLSSSSSSDAASVNSELEWDFEDVTVQWSRPSPAVQHLPLKSSSELCPGTFGQAAASPRLPERPSPWQSKQ
ncbi:transmembrane protein 44 [Struthio camelus]|uniref:transmembrane protein 44 n=1 Tax=Struthio camelus TaxID=8801 RepID=UPI003603CFF1